MKNAIILHGTSSSSKSNWFPWLSTELEAAGWQVWVPDLPGADTPIASVYTEYILSNVPFAIDEHTTIIGHSSGAVEVLALLQALPTESKIHEAVLVGSFTKLLASEPEWPMLSGLFEEDFDFDKIRSMSGCFTFYHGDNDPYCPIDQARDLAQETGGELNIIPGAGHFSYELDSRFVEFPELRDHLLTNIY